ncbi:hypothetical protein ACWEV3_28530, partial [Saccharopolyspora sp. NPDC003752]
GEIQPGQIVIVDVEGWDGEGADDKSHFTFRGEQKPSLVPDAPPVAVSAASEEKSEGTDSE